VGLGRYLVKVTGAAALINFGLNFAVARWHYGPMARVPVDGKGGLGDDTVINAFLICAITFWVLFPAARREARSGRVRGGGSDGKLLGWVARHAGSAGAIVGVAGVVLLAIPSLALLKGLGYTSLAGAQVAWPKGLFATAVAVVAALGTALAGIAREADISDDARWCRDPAATTGVAWPLDYVDKGSLALTSGAHGCSCTPTWQLLVRGALDPADVKRALADTIARYPSLATRVQALDGVPPEARR
jgi:hypothetical protein